MTVRTAAPGRALQPESQPTRESQRGTVRLEEVLDEEVNHEHNELPPRTTEPSIKMGKKQGIKVASLNLRGLRSSMHECKIERLNHIIRNERIGIMAIQESHTTEEKLEELKHRYRNLDFITNDGTSRSAGVMFIINKDIITPTNVKHKCLIKGRASMLKLNWKDNARISIVNVYLPNDRVESRDALKKLRSKLERRNVDLLLGDFNLTEDAHDRFPTREDDNECVDELIEIKRDHALVDGWRRANPKTIQYSYHRRDAVDGVYSKSRIDRIYSSRDIYDWAYDWEIQTAQGLSDHDWITVTIADKNLPHIGEGLFRLHNEQLENPKLTKDIRDALHKCETDIQTWKRDGTSNPNPIECWVECKETIKQMSVQAGKITKARRGQLENQLRLQVAKDITDEANSNNEPDLDKQRSTELIRDKLAEIAHDKTSKALLTKKARYMLKGESTTKYWLRIKKSRRKHANTILGLHDGNGTLKTNTRDMTKIATNHHKKLQAAPGTSEERKAAIKEMIKNIDTKISPQGQETLAKPIDNTDIVQALKAAQNDKSPGEDGLPYEFYKHWMDRYNESQEQEGDKTSNEPDIVTILCDVYQFAETTEDVEEAFTKGVMFLLHKKKDKREIENYRPITLLNTDYKLLTKIIAMRLAKVCPAIIHRDQAGFIPGRDIFDQVKLTKLMIDYTETTEEGGAAIALDQEKAYDRIAHDYLWEVLEAFGLPENTMRLIKNLYKNAKTAVMVNGVAANPINIARGVRQGCPMSCLIFDMAIEPLANALRNSDLKGFNIPGKQERLLTKLFADDMIVYLNATDDAQKLTTILDLYCLASTAKFNTTKTEIIPLGPPTFRKELIEHRRMIIDSEPAKELNISGTIINDGQPMRTLGGWVGNCINDAAVWSTILEKQQAVMKEWSDLGLTFRGKKIIISTLVISQAQYLATVNRMPDRTLEQMQKQIKDFIWNGRSRGLLPMQILEQPIENGGLEIPSLATKREALDIYWGRKWLLDNDERPDWAFIVDELLRRDIPKSFQPTVTNDMITNWALQKWDVHKNLMGTTPTDIKEMLKALRKYNTQIDGAKFAAHTKDQLPAWLSTRAEDASNFLQNKKSSKCLRANHQVRTIKDLAVNLGDHACDNPLTCAKMADKLMDHVFPKYNPMNRTPTKDGLDLTPNRKLRNQRAKRNNEPIILNPDITERRSALECLRIFGSKTTAKNPAYRTRTTGRTPEELVIYTDGSCYNNGTDSARSGAGAWHDHESEFNQVIRLPGPPSEQSNQRAELVAIMATLAKVPPCTPLLIKTDSMYAVNGLSTHYAEWEDKGWSGVCNSDIWRKTLYLMRCRSAETRIQWVKGHADEYGNEMADDLADQGATKEETDVLDLTIPLEWDTTGARLTSLTLRTIYLTLMKRKHTETSEKLGNTLRNIQERRNEIDGTSPTVGAIWHSLRKEEITREIGDFLWRLIHNRLKCGRWFLNIPNWEHLAACDVCDATETPEHILLHCPGAEQNCTWKVAQLLWETSEITQGVEWRKPTLEDLMSIGLIKVKNSKGKTARGPTRLYRILVTEALWQIWKGRCSRRIGGTSLPPKAITNRSLDIFRRRALTDSATTRLCETSNKRFKQRNELVDETWEGLLVDNGRDRTWIFKSNKN